MDTAAHCPASQDGEQLRECSALPRTQEAASVARRLTRAALQAWAFPAGDWSVDVCLVVTELVTNAVRHGGTALRLELACAGRCVTVGVVDDAPGIPRPRASTDDDEDGRGMLIVAALTCGWGVDAPLTGDLPGKRVWARLCAPSAPGSAGAMAAVRG